MTPIRGILNEIQEGNTRTGTVQGWRSGARGGQAGEVSRSVTIPHLATVANWLDVLPTLGAHEPKRSQRIRIPQFGSRHIATGICLMGFVVECSIFGVLMMP